MIAVDALGGDHAPLVPIEGACKAAQQGIEVQLYGPKDHVASLLYKFLPTWHDLPITLIDCTHHITMADDPVKAVRSKPDSSLVKAARAVASGEAQALVSAGNTGAVLVAGVCIIGKVPGVSRPALGDFLPTSQGSVFWLDLGAHKESKAEYLLEYAWMGHTFVQIEKGIAHPRIALLANGTERSKGSSSVQTAYALLEQAPLRFVGYAEPTADLEQRADVVVCDGFTGNVMLKSIEATATILKSWMKQECYKSWSSRAKAFLASSLFNDFGLRLDAHNKGGALLLGVKSPVIKAHGSCDARAFYKALVYAHSLVSDNTVFRFNENLSHLINSSKVQDSINSRDFVQQSPALL